MNNFANAIGDAPDSSRPIFVVMPGGTLNIGTVFVGNNNNINNGTQNTLNNYGTQTIQNNSVMSVEYYNPTPQQFPYNTLAPPQYPYNTLALPDNISQSPNSQQDQIIEMDFEEEEEPVAATSFIDPPPNYPYINPLNYDSIMRSKLDHTLAQKLTCPKCSLILCRPVTYLCGHSECCVCANDNAGKLGAACSTCAKRVRKIPDVCKDATEVLETIFKDRWVVTMLWCSQCDRPKKQPHTLECGHSFCITCTHKIFEASDGMVGEDFVMPGCPTCLLDASFPTQMNIVLGHLLDAVADAMSGIGQSGVVSEEWLRAQRGESSEIEQKNTKKIHKSTQSGEAGIDAKNNSNKDARNISRSTQSGEAGIYAKNNSDTDKRNISRRQHSNSNDKKPEADQVFYNAPEATKKVDAVVQHSNSNDKNPEAVKADQVFYNALEATKKVDAVVQHNDKKPEAVKAGDFFYNALEAPKKVDAVVQHNDKNPEEPESDEVAEEPVKADQVFYNALEAPKKVDAVVQHNDESDEEPESDEVVEEPVPFFYNALEATKKVDAIVQHNDESDEEPESDEVAEEPGDFLYNALEAPVGAIVQHNDKNPEEPESDEVAEEPVAFFYNALAAPVGAIVQHNDESDEVAEEPGDFTYDTTKKTNKRNIDQSYEDNPNTNFFRRGPNNNTLSIEGELVGSVPQHNTLNSHINTDYPDGILPRIKLPRLQLRGVRRLKKSN